MSPHTWLDGWGGRHLIVHQGGIRPAGPSKGGNGSVHGSQQHL